ncbi:MAG TPA: BBP7 family outer membrane beta-barrel protein [Gemmataceae bacterium]|nr:BBP7 family outer membrane beta-barrel protein [Gemmataceae bacterium]
MKTHLTCGLLICLVSAGWARAQSVAADSPGNNGSPKYLPSTGGVARADVSPVLSAQPALSREPAVAEMPPCGQQCDRCCAPGSDCWVSADYLLWWFKDAHTPPLVTSGTPASAGILGRPGTTTLFGGRGLDLEDHSGVRVTAGTLLDEDRLTGIEGSYFFLGERGTGFSASSAGNPVLARPFFNVNLHAQDSELAAFPGLVTGTVRVALDSQLQSAEVNFLCVLDEDCNRRLILFAGYRYAQLDEGLGVVEDLVVPGEAIIGAGRQIRVADSFVAHSHFYGGQVGLRGEWWQGLVFARIEGKVALGLCHESVNIDGRTQFASPGGPVTSQAGGLLALPSNIGRFHRDEFAVIPEVGVKLGCQLTNTLALTLGYSFLYWSEVVRPGNQIDFSLNPSQLPTSNGPGSPLGAARPAHTLHGTDFWAQGLSAGLELRY